ncbi:MAG: hypothetical protein ACMVP2_14665 [Imperialibacter sp.]|uniref:hypothetical protein n=1 Tax=Imperialibacter sp. TaxID=2038411 RepID=UPI003A844524
MKAFLLSQKRILSSVSLGVLIAGTLIFVSCGLDDENPTCTGCTAASPWSKAGAGTCYATQTDCERVEGGTCVICN